MGDLPPSPLTPQLKISFSETALETTYQYPSESSVLRELGPEPEAPSAPAAQPDDDEEEEEEELQAERPGGLLSKALLVGEWRRRWREGAAWRPERTLRSWRKMSLEGPAGPLADGETEVLGDCKTRAFPELPGVG